jgi:molybdopterin molybdotransferase
MTGAPCPEGTELGAQYEICEQQGDRVRLPNIPSNGTNIALRGSECTKGATILSEGQEISGLCTAVLSTFGRTEVSVHPNPTISIVVTGDEVEKIAGPCEDTSIRDSNGPMLRAMALNLGVEEIRTIRVGDTACKLVSALEKASEADLVLVTGGVSAGKFDLVPESLRTLGVELIFHKVTQKPGKPFLFGLKNGQPFFGLPGNPLACHLCFHRYIVPSILKMSGKPPRLSSGHGNLTGKVRGTGSRTRFQLVQLSEDYSTNGLPNVTPLIGRGSADIFAPVSADAYIRVPPRIAQVDKGDVVEYELIGA